MGNFFYFGGVGFFLILVIFFSFSLEKTAVLFSRVVFWMFFNNLNNFLTQRDDFRKAIGFGSIPIACYSGNPFIFGLLALVWSVFFSKNTSYVVLESLLVCF